MEDMPEFLALTDNKNRECVRLGAFSGETEKLLLKHEGSQTGILACLDDLLGAIYNLFYALHYGYADRPQPLTKVDMGNVRSRAKDMASWKVRIDGKWTAGVYFNNALFRLAGVYHRTLKIASGNLDTWRFPHKLIPQVQKSYEAAQGSPWTYTSVQAIYDEVNARLSL